MTTVHEEEREIKRRSKTIRSIKDKKLSAKLCHAYSNMRRRCYDERNRQYKYYGEKGITICDEWLNNRDSFYIWSLENGFGPSKTIDRIDSTKGYSPDNCRWVEPIVQNNNKSDNVWVEYNGERHTIAQWARILDMDVKTLYARWESGSPPDKILSKEDLNHKPVVQISMETGEVIAEYPSALAASKAVGFKNNRVWRVCAGLRISAAGYYWAFKGEEQKERRKPVLQDKPVMRLSEDGEKSKYYKNLRQAASELGCNSQTISRACKSGRFYFGYYWRYAEDDNRSGCTEKVG